MKSQHATSGLMNQWDSPRRLSFVGIHQMLLFGFVSRLNLHQHSNCRREKFLLFLYVYYNMRISICFFCMHVEPISHCTTLVIWEVSSCYKKYSYFSEWLVQSRQPESPLEVRHLVNSWPQRQQERVHHPPGVWRSLTGTGQVLSPSEKSEGTRNLPSCSSESSPSSVSWEKSLKTSRLTSGSRAQQLELFRYVTSKLGCISKLSD